MADCQPNQRFNRLIAGGGVNLPGIDVGAALTGCCDQDGLTRRPPPNAAVAQGHAFLPRP